MGSKMSPTLLLSYSLLVSGVWCLVSGASPLVTLLLPTFPLTTDY